MKAIVLAAGHTSGLYELTKDRPLTLLPVGGKVILDYISEELMTLPSLNEIIIVTNHRFFLQFQRWRERAENRYSLPLTIIDDLTTSDADKLGQIGDLDYAIRRLEIQEEVVIIAADNLFIHGLIDAWRVFREFGQDLILAQELDSLVHLRCSAVAMVDAHDRVIGLEVKPAEPKSKLAVYAAYFYCKETLPLIHQYLEDGGSNEALGYLAAWLCRQKTLRLYRFTGECFHIDTPKAYAEAEEKLRHKRH